MAAHKTLPNGEVLYFLPGYNMLTPACQQPATQTLKPAVGASSLSQLCPYPLQLKPHLSDPLQQAQALIDGNYQDSSVCEIIGCPVPLSANPEVHRSWQAGFTAVSALSLAAHALLLWQMWRAPTFHVFPGVSVMAFCACKALQTASLLLSPLGGFSAFVCTPELRPGSFTSSALCGAQAVLLQFFALAAVFHWGVVAWFLFKTSQVNDALWSPGLLRRNTVIKLLIAPAVASAVVVAVLAANNRLGSHVSGLFCWIRDDEPDDPNPAAYTHVWEWLFYGPLIATMVYSLFAIFTLVRTLSRQAGLRRGKSKSKSKSEGRSSSSAHPSQRQPSRFFRCCCDIGRGQCGACLGVVQWLVFSPDVMVTNGLLVVVGETLSAALNMSLTLKVVAALPSFVGGLQSSIACALLGFVKRFTSVYGDSPSGNLQDLEAICQEQDKSEGSRLSLLVVVSVVMLSSSGLWLLLVFRREKMCKCFKAKVLKRSALNSRKNTASSYKKSSYKPSTGSTFRHKRMRSDLPRLSVSQSHQKSAWKYKGPSLYSRKESSLKHSSLESNEFEAVEMAPV